MEVLLLGLFLRPFYLNISNSFSIFCRCEIKIGSSFYFTVFFGFVNGYYYSSGPSLSLKRHIEYCFRLNLSSGFLEDSVIVGNNKNHLTSLRNWLVPVEQSSASVWKRCWRASVDGWASRTFHSRCDGKGPTVTIIRVARYIFGGYTSLPWGTLIMKSEINLLQFLLTFT